MDNWFYFLIKGVLALDCLDWFTMLAGKEDE